MIDYIVNSQEYVKEDGTVGTQTSVYKKVREGHLFYRVQLIDLLAALGVAFSSKQLKIFEYIIRQTNTKNNYFTGTVKHIAKKTEISYRTVYDTIQQLMKVNLLGKETNGLYAVNPAVLMIGDSEKQNRLVVEYEMCFKTSEVIKSQEDLDKKLKEAEVSKKQKAVEVILKTEADSMSAVA